MQEFSINRVVPLMLSVTDIHQYTTASDYYPYSVIVSNNTGSITHQVTNVTWNVNLEILLGDLYDRFDYFNLELVQFMTIPYTSSGAFNTMPLNNSINDNKDYRNLNVYLSGLQFVRSTFNQKVGNETIEAHICNISEQFNVENVETTGTYRNDEYLIYNQKGYSSYNLCFKKEKNVKLNIKLGSITSGLNYTPETVFIGDYHNAQHFNAKFNIIPFK